MAADAAARLARLELHDAPHPLELVEVLVEGLEVEHLAGRGVESWPSRPPRPAPARATPWPRSSASRRARCTLWIGVAYQSWNGSWSAWYSPSGSSMQVGAHLLADAEVLDRPALDVGLEPLVDVGHDELPHLGLGHVGVVRRRQSAGGGSPAASRRRAHAADRRIEVQQFAVAVAVDHVQPEPVAGRVAARGSSRG